MSRRSRGLGSATATTAATTAAPAPLALDHALQRTPARPRAEALQRRAARNLKRLVAPGSVARARRFSAGGWPSLPFATRARPFRPSASARLRAFGTAGSAHTGSSVPLLSSDIAARPSTAATASPQPGISDCNTAPADTPAGTAPRTPSAGRVAPALGRPVAQMLASWADSLDLQVGPREIDAPSGSSLGGESHLPSEASRTKPTPTSSPACTPA